MLALVHAIPFGTWPVVAVSTVFTIYLGYLQLATRSRTTAWIAAIFGLFTIVNLFPLFNITSGFAITIGISLCGLALLLSAKFFESTVTTAKDSKPEKPGGKSAGTKLEKLYVGGNLLVLAGAIGAILFTGNSFVSNSLGWSQLGSVSYTHLTLPTKRIV